ncbi:MAG: ribbon-helix-helix domain-containing protein [Pseudolabrys sp.]|nr:ribbon-helix-helix domain-containing protein [Pseudolabrys sp.]MDP2293849.1 ribbon-helix-helix domain-containing protein [Pseudolabrys sp.]
MKPVIAKRSVVVAGNRTSVSVEDQFWLALREIAYNQKQSLADIVTEIKTHQPGNLSSGIRLFVLDRLSTQIRDQSGFRLASPVTQTFDDERPTA